VRSLLGVCWELHGFLFDGLLRGLAGVCLGPLGNHYGVCWGSVWGLFGVCWGVFLGGSKLDVINISLITNNNTFNPDLIYRAVYP
jgi:hypothetical protein